jgi:hypothetical protein
MHHFGRRLGQEISERLLKATLVGCSRGSAILTTGKRSYWKDFVVRTYDPKTDLWRLYWVDNTFSEGVIQPPVFGKFNGNVGIFEGNDTFGGEPILVRFTWMVNP